jgi:hypothetical protein
MYDKLFYIHINKVGGRYARENIIFPLYLKLNQLGIKTQVGHSNVNWINWYEAITDSTYVVCNFRDPVKRHVSQYCHRMGYISDIDRTAIFRPEENIPSVEDMKKEFLGSIRGEITKPRDYKWHHHYGDFSVANQQSGFFVMDIIQEKMKNENKILNDFVIADYKDEIMNRINRIDLFIKSDVMKDLKNAVVIKEKIMSNFGFENYRDDHKINILPDFNNSYSQQLYNLLTEDEIEEIRQYNWLDSEIYNNQELFWDPNI